MSDYCRKPHRSGSGGWYYCDRLAGHVEAEGYEYHSSDGGKIPERPVVTLGDESAYALGGCVKLEIWREELVDGVKTGFIQRDRGRPIWEIAREVAEVLRSEDLLDESFSDISWWERSTHERAAERARGIASEPFNYGGRWEIAVSPPGLGGVRHVERFDKREDAVAYRDRVREAYAFLPHEMESEAGPGIVGDVYLWPDKVRFIACYAVTGGSEGHYVHVDVLHDCQHTVVGHVRVARGIFLAKTFRGMDHATRMAARIAVLLGA